MGYSGIVLGLVDCDFKTRPFLLVVSSEHRISLAQSCDVLVRFLAVTMYS